MSEEVPLTDDRAVRFATAATPEERAVVIGYDFAFVQRRGAQLLGFILLFEVVVVAALFIWATATGAEVDIVAGLAAVFAGVVISVGTSLLGGALNSRDNATEVQRTVVSLGLDVVKVGLLVLAISLLPAGLGSMLFLVAGFAIGSGATINALVPAQFTRLVERADPRALVAADQLAAYPLWVTGLSRSMLPAVATLMCDTAAWGASVLLIQVSPWSALIVLLVGLASGRLWLLGATRNNVRLAVGSSFIAALVLAVTAVILLPSVVSR